MRKEKKKASIDRMKGVEPQGHKTGNRKRQRERTDKHLWMKGENVREGRQRAETLLKKPTNLILCVY